MTTPNNEIVITESAMKRVLSNDETFRLKCLVESLHEEVLKLKEQVASCNGACKKEKKDAKG